MKEKKRTNINGQEQAPKIEKGYVFSVCDDSDFYTPIAVHIERDDNLVPWRYESDEEAAIAAELDGVKLIYGMQHVADGVYTDTPGNRSLILEMLNQYPEYLDVGCGDKKHA